MDYTKEKPNSAFRKNYLFLVGRLIQKLILYLRLEKSINFINK